MKDAVSIPSRLPDPIPFARAAWRPLLEGEDQERAAEALAAIDAVLAGIDPCSLRPSLSGGSMGLSVYFAYRSLALGEGKEGPCRRRALDIMDIASSHAYRLEGDFGLFGGYAGLGWVVDHLRNIGFLQVEGDPNQDLDAALLEHLGPDSWRGLPELVNGLAGLGLYALDRHGRGASAAILGRVLERLGESCEQTAEGLAWFDPPELLYPEAREAMPEGLFNLGVSHGNAGIAGFLAEAARRSPEATALLEGCVPWLLAQQEAHLDGSRFGFGFARGDLRRNPDGSRLAWCYGDLGTAVVLVLAAQRTGNPQWMTQALDLAEACANRPEPFRGIQDACLCHGAMGNGHLFNRLYQATGRESLRQAALAMFGRGLNQRRAAGPWAGFTPFTPGREPGDLAVEMLLGLTGIGLALLAATSPLEPLWDRHLLAHAAPRAV